MYLTTLLCQKVIILRGASLTVQCEIIHQNMLGGLLQDEDIPLGGLDDNFVFPGFGVNQVDQQFDQDPASLSHKPWKIRAMLTSSYLI